MIEALAHFFMSLWLWAMTWGIYQIPLALFFMVLLFRWTGHLRLLPSLGIGIGANLFSWGIYTLVIIVFFVGAMGYEYDAQGSHRAVFDALHACLYWGLLNTVLQSIFFMLLNHWYRIS